MLICMIIPNVFLLALQLEKKKEVYFLLPSLAVPALPPSDSRNKIMLYDIIMQLCLF